MLGFFVLQPFVIEADWDVGLGIGCGHENSGFEVTYSFLVVPKNPFILYTSHHKHTVFLKRSKRSSTMVALPKKENPLERNDPLRMGEAGKEASSSAASRPLWLAGLPFASPSLLCSIPYPTYTLPCLVHCYLKFSFLLCRHLLQKPNLLFLLFLWVLGPIRWSHRGVGCL